jgi:hypothetical protein
MGVCGGGEDDLDSSAAVSPCLTVLIDGDGGVGTVASGGAGAARFRARYERYEGAPLIVIGEGTSLVVSSLGWGAVSEEVQMSIRSWVVSSGREESMARP